MSRRIYAGTSSITWDDTWHRIDVNGYVLHLSPTQYRVCRLFLAASKPKNALLTDELVILSYRSYSQLEEDGAMPRAVLVKHISDLNTRIAASGLRIRSFHTGYILTCSFNPVANEQSAEESSKRE